MFKSKLFAKLTFILLAGWFIVGCDTTDPEGDGSDAARFIGGWTVTSAADMGGARDVTSTINALGTLSFTLNEDETYLLSLQYADGETEDLDIPGNYTVNEVGKRLVLSVQVEGQPEIDLILPYEFVDDSEVKLTVDGITVSILLGPAGSSLEGGVELTAEKN